MAVKEKDPLAPDADLEAKLREIDRIAQEDEREAQRRLDAMTDEQRRRLRKTQDHFFKKMNAGLDASDGTVVREGDE